ncbi:MAG: type II secretion system minor pseudopilin GspH [Gammaproteobacteria bacterium]
MRGFTLVEILVVLLIVGILTGIAVLSLSAIGHAPRREQTARHLASLIELASQQAITEGEQLGLRVSRHRYTFVRNQEGRWKTFHTSSIYRMRHVPGGVHLSLLLRGTPIALRAPLSKSKRKHSGRAPSGAVLPQILILSNGELSGFEIDVYEHGHRRPFRIRGNPTGHISLVAPHSTHS